MQHIESISVMPAVAGTLRATVGRATGEEDSATVEDITNDGVALNPQGRVTLDNVAKQACRKLSKKEMHITNGNLECEDPSKNRETALVSKIIRSQ